MSESTSTQAEAQTSPSAQAAPQTPKAAPTAEERVAQLETELKEREAKFLYLYAEFENFKKRAVKERSDLVKFGWENTARDLLQVIDNLERGLEHVPAGTDKALADGLKMVLQLFRSTLERSGVQTVSALHQPFDPNLHEAIAQEPSEEHAAGVIIQEQIKGYTLHGRLLRPARVVVSTGASKTQADLTSSESKPS